MTETYRERALFAKMPVMTAIRKLALPTIAGQIILVVYNMADTFFIGLTGDDAKITAVTICLPAFMFLSAIANLFGVGGAGEASRSLGTKDNKRAGETCAFSFWGCAAMTLVYVAAAVIFRHPFLEAMGAGAADVHRFAVTYLLVTVGIGGLGTAMNMVTAHLFRAEGRSLDASIGIVLGSILNIVLDPIFMFVLLPPGKEVLGAALATAISNWISLLIMIVLQLRRRKNSVLRFGNPLRADREMVRGVLSTGLPACVMTLFENISYACMDRLMMANGTAAQAGLGVAKKINMLAHATVRGLTQGVLPLIAYNYASRNHQRTNRVIRYTVLIAFGIGTAWMIACLTLSRPLVGIFLEPGGSRTIGARILRILTVGGPFSACAYTFISFFQAVKRPKKALLLALLRKGILDIPMMFVFRLFAPLTGIAIATPLADILCCLTSFTLFTAYYKKHFAADAVQDESAG
ncbi:MAG: hypothetical protein IKI15_03370 [Lachnospiraceae bacterium]|nr:hypothetical protein [Lachnospiraceae bacterium]